MLVLWTAFAMENENKEKLTAAPSEEASSPKQEPFAKKERFAAKSNRRKTLFKAGVALCLALLLGVGAGLGAAKLLKHDIYEYADAAAYRDDLAATMRQYERIKKGGGNYASMKAYDLINASYCLYSRQQRSSSIGVGVSLAIMNTRQVIQSRTAREGDRYFEESNSYSNFVSIYNRMYQEGDTTTTYWGSKSDYANHAKKSYSNEEYAEMMGRKVSEGLIYIVSSKTVIEGEAAPSGDAPTAVRKTAEGYVAEIELKRSSSVINYVKQMQKISNLSGKPIFDYVHLTVYTDAELMLKKMVTHEKYTAVMAGLSSPCEGRLATEYKIDEQAEAIPELSRSLSYPSSI